MTHKVVFSPEAQQQLSDLLDYIAYRASPAIAMAYTDGIVSYCESLSTFPQRGNLLMRRVVRPGLNHMLPHDPYLAKMLRNPATGLLLALMTLPAVVAAFARHTGCRESSWLPRSNCP